VDLGLDAVEGIEGFLGAVKILPGTFVIFDAQLYETDKDGGVYKGVLGVLVVNLPGEVLKEGEALLVIYTASKVSRISMGYNITPFPV
jgi:hypothetical protein